MIIRRKDTVRDILVKKRDIYSMASQQIIDRLKGRAVPEYIKSGFMSIEARDLSNATVYELSLVENLNGSYIDYFCRTLSAVLKNDNGAYLSKNEVLDLRFIPSMILFIKICDQLKVIADKFKGLDVPLSGKERAAAVEITPMGLQDLVSSFCRRCPSYTHEQAFSLEWGVVYRELLFQWQETMTQRNYARMLNNKK